LHQRTKFFDVPLPEFLSGLDLHILAACFFSSRNGVEAFGARDVLLSLSFLVARSVLLRGAEARPEEGSF
jgi:hypothetical protein